jgi:serine/threonine protein kinase
MQNTLPIGTILRNQYLVQELLSKGAFSAVYLVNSVKLVEDPRGKRYISTRFALKEVVIPSRHLRHHINIETIALRGIDHEGLPHIYDVFNISKYNRLYILMDNIEGPDLEKVRLQQPGRHLPLAQVMTIMAPILGAVSYLHSQQPSIIHQNIEPASIIISQADNKPVLVGFGVGKQYNLSSQDGPVRDPMIGYEAPEQYGGEISTRTDIYGLGATLYTLLTGIVPADARHRKRLIESENSDPLKPVDQLVPAFPAHVAEAIQRAMSLDSTDRFATVQQFEQALKVADSTRSSGPSPELKLGLILQDLDLPSKVDSAEQESSEPLLAPTAAAQSRTDLLEQKSPEPFLAPSLPAEQHSPEPEVVPPALVEQEPPEPEVVPLALVEQEPPIAYDVPPETIEQQPLIADGIPSAPTQSPVIPEEAVEIPAADSLAVHPRTIRSSKPGVILLGAVALLIGISLGVVFWSFLFNPGSRSATPTSAVLHKTTPQSSARPAMTSTPIPSSTTFANMSGSYQGTIYSILANVTTTMSLAGIQQSQGNISGYFTGLQVSGQFIGIIDASRHIRFIVMNSAGYSILSFDGAVQSDGNLAGSYCSLNPAGQCAGAYGVWSAAPVSP